VTGNFQISIKYLLFPFRQGFQGFLNGKNLLDCIFELIERQFEVVEWLLEMIERLLEVVECSAQVVFCYFDTKYFFIFTDSDRQKSS